MFANFVDEPVRQLFPEFLLDLRAHDIDAEALRSLAHFQNHQPGAKLREPVDVEVVGEGKRVLLPAQCRPVSSQCFEAWVDRLGQAKRN